MSHGTGFDTGRLLAMSRPELDRLFLASPPGGIPWGKGIGTVLLGRGTKVSTVAATLVRRLAWQGKVFDYDRGELRNMVTPFGVRAVRAKVYRDESWLDDGECIVLDYSHTSLLAHWIRDEIRCTGHGTYLGVVYWGRHRILHFGLSFRDPQP